MGKKIYLIVLIVLTLVNLSAFGFWITRKVAPPAPESRFEQRFEEHRKRMKRDFPEEVLAKMRTNQMAFRHTADSLARRIRAARRALVDELLQPEPDQGRLDSLLTEIAHDRQVLDKKLTEHLLSQKQYLTPKQQQMFFRMMLSRIVGEHPPRRIPRTPKPPTPRR